MNFIISCSGCLSLLLIVAILVFLLKFGGIVIFLLLVYLLVTKRYDWVERIIAFIKPKEKKIKPGQIYKQCTFCGAKADRNDSQCPRCNKSFEG